MEPATFTIEFPEHMPRDKWQYCLDQLADEGAQVETLGSHTFLIVCDKPTQLNHVGWALYQSHFVNLCRVVGTSGDAVPRANAYRRPDYRK